MSCERLVAVGACIAAISGIPGLCFGRQSSFGQRLATLLLLIGNACSLTAAGRFLAGEPGGRFSLPAPIPQTEFTRAAEFTWALDTLSVFFLIPICVISSLGSIYGLSYWKQSEHPDNGRKMWLFFGLITACMQTLVAAQSTVLFLFGWEGMAISAFFLVATEDQDEETRNAGWLFLAASHLATLCLFALFGLMAYVAGEFAWTSLAGASPAMQTAIFLVALLGFGLKAGIMPLHVWLPSAHAMAPSHVSALMSGMLIKMGIYGLVRTTSLFPHPPLWWGGLLLVLGGVSGVLAIAYAIGQHDLKRLLAYSSIENIGIITIGIGLALVGRSLGRTDWVLLGMGGALLHVWNHASFKSLLFLCSGSLIHATHTRRIDLLGGLAKSMPRTSLCFLIGSVAVCGLPPLNGFVSEFLIYVGIFRTLGIGEGPTWATAAFAAPVLATIGALAVACFVQVFGVVFLGSPRTDHARHAHESSFWMTGPMFVLAAICVGLGVFPALVAPVVEQAVGVWQPTLVDAGLKLSPLAPLESIGSAAAALLAFMTASALYLAWRLHSGEIGHTETWGCGYMAPTARMQYTGSSFGQMLVRIFGWALRPQITLPELRGIFPSSARFRSEVPDFILSRLVLPAFWQLARLFSWFRLLQQGSIHAYLVYILVIVVVLLLWR